MDSFKAHDSNKKQIEKQVLKIWDTMYNSWLSKVSCVISFDNWNLVSEFIVKSSPLYSIEYSYLLKSVYTGSIDSGS